MLPKPSPTSKGFFYCGIFPVGFREALAEDAAKGLKLCFQSFSQIKYAVRKQEL